MMTTKQTPRRVRTFTDVCIGDGRKFWQVSGTWDRLTGEMEITELHGDVNDTAGIGLALRRRYSQRPNVRNNQ